MSESLATQYRFLSVFLAARNWGPLRFANTEPDPASPGRMVLLVIFPRGVEYNTPIYNEENAAAAYADIVEYQIRHGYNHVEFFDQGRVKLEIIYAGFHRRTSDLKRDLGIFETDLPPPMPAPIDLNHEVEKLGLSRAAALKALQREAAQQAAQRRTRRLKWDKDALPDENPAQFAWRAYQAEAKAGTLHMGVIRQDDKKNGTELAVKLVSWLRSPANRQQLPEGFDIPTKPEWNTRQLATRGGNLPSGHGTVQPDNARLYAAARYRAQLRA